ncbi:hypothetical protein EVAR_40673_1 [Eumeta japonica]|uniref:Uncharacterized protein n=1 Tax=Eumeta variegata TaxID=151549 RepID=A0A4C1X319_EUMVA|nr:hypothetical protein EVAR_40673_1 [Eumeta japonica]
MLQLEERVCRPAARPARPRPGSPYNGNTILARCNFVPAGAPLADTAHCFWTCNDNRWTRNVIITLIKSTVDVVIYVNALILARSSMNIPRVSIVMIVVTPVSALSFH